MADDVIINDELSIPMSELEFLAVRASGAGGQNVNKVASAIHLRFDIRASHALPDDVRARLLASKDSRISADGVLVIKSREHRTRERNRRAAIDRLRDVIETATRSVQPRRKTRPPRRATEDRLSAKRHRADTKRRRGPVKDEP